MGVRVPSGGSTDAHLPLNPLHGDHYFNITARRVTEYEPASMRTK